MNPVHLWLTPEWLYWAFPWALLLTLVLPLLWWLWRRPQRRTAMRFSSLQALHAAGATSAARLRLALPILRTIALLALIVAVARPQRPDESSSLFAEGIAIQLVVDTSSSMRDDDLSPRGGNLTRLDVVKEVIRRFVKGGDTLPGRPNDLIGMVRFARYADSVCPLTLDHDSLLDVLATTQTVRVREEDMTAIGDGLALGVERMRDLKRISGSGEQLKINSRVIILLTDGENNAGQIAPEQAGELAATYGIKVYTILAGTGQNLGFVRRPVDARALKSIAEVSGGKFFQARNAEALERIYREIDQLERTRTEERRFVRWGELSRPWLLAAFVCVVSQVLLDGTRLRKIP